MPASLGAVVISTPRPQQLAGFYRELLGWQTVSESPDWVRLRAPGQERPGLSFQLEPDFAAPDWPARPDGVQLQSHLDILVDDLDAEVARATSLGARVEHQQFSAGVRVMRDPHGHVFCLFVQGF